jgi:hypothetical protein
MLKASTLEKVGVLRPPCVPPAFLPHRGGCLTVWVVLRMLRLCLLVHVFLLAVHSDLFSRNGIVSRRTSDSEWATLPKTPLPASIVVDERTKQFLEHLPKNMLVRPEDL